MWGFLRSYSPQGILDDRENREIMLDSSVVLSVSDRHAGNEYVWYKDGSAIENSDSSDYSISSFGLLDEGDYYVKVRNKIAPRLVLVRDTISLLLYNRENIVDSLVLVELYKSTDGPNWKKNSNWLVEGKRIASWHGVSINSNGRVDKFEFIL